jgi:HTH-type transcriptional regulator/antitoxin HipB
LRKARKQTQAELGRLLGVKQSRIADIEGDPGSVSVSQLHQMLSALGAQMLLRESGGGGWIPTDKGSAAEPLPRTRAAKKSTGSW